MEIATRLTAGVVLGTTLVGSTYIFTACGAWGEVAVGAFWWATSGAVMTAVLASGAWWMVLRDTRRHAGMAGFEDAAIEASNAAEPIAGYVGPREVVPRDTAPIRRAA
ncbi:hypothetical protein Pla108_34450 [Botrimarina colliarenosi]|uniref:Uncharacterized protein n=1 Tax=Botrimarina colliarenosi TaxID=2528001 RepID=A0A5C6A7D5_9BACT|nr:hypothetical protein [Botrimarina colliarenosi]TWT95300.1 hypothetical protein Pla108_34450 [Botrimarina colliarenosi]